MNGQAALLEVEPTVTPTRPAHNARQIQALEAEIEDLRGQVEWLEEDIEHAEARIEQLRKADREWPDKWTLLAVYGAPGNWPVEPAVGGEQR